MIILCTAAEKSQFFGFKHLNVCQKTFGKYSDTPWPTTLSELLDILNVFLLQFDMKVREAVKLLKPFNSASPCMSLSPTHLACQRPAGMF